MVSKKDILYEMYNKNKLNFEWLQFIIDKCTDYFNVYSSLIKIIMEYNAIELLDIIFINH